MRRSLLLLLALLSVAASGKPAPVSIKFNPAQAFPRSTIVVTLHIERSPDNRAISWVCDSENAYFSRAMNLDGENTWATYEDRTTLRDMVYPGVYECVAELTRTTSVERATGRFTIIGGE